MRAAKVIVAQQEEMILFPGIINVEADRQTSFACGGSIDHPIEMMTQEHDEAGDALAKMRELTGNFAPPADACNTFSVLLHSLARLELVMHQHVHKENNILFPRALELMKSVPAERAPNLRDSLKRHPSLKPFSRDHGVGLLCAQRLRKAVSASVVTVPASAPCRSDSRAALCVVAVV